MKKTTTRLTVITALLGLFLAAGSARAADWVKIIGMNPPSPASLPGVSGGPMVPGNSIEIVFTYNLETQANARIGFYTAGEAGNLPIHTGVEVPFMVTKKGPGEGKTRISVMCNGKYDSCPIRTIRYDMFFDVPAPGSGLLKLFEDRATVEYMFKCPPSTQPGTNPTRTPTPGNPTGGPGPGGSPPGHLQKPNITSARPGLYIWGSDPTNKHWVEWNHDVKLKAGESIHPNQGNGPCAFNVQYFEKETNGVATAPFKNKLYSDANERASDGPSALAASEARALTMQPNLDPGGHGLKLVLDADGNVSETNEADNAFSIRYSLSGRCGPATGASTGVSTAPKK